MNIATELQTAVESLATAYKAACANPLPNYSIDGQSVSHGEYLKMLSEAIKATQELIAMFDPVELRSVIM